MLPRRHDPDGTSHTPGARLVRVEAEVRQLPTGRLLAIDERGVGLRATWRLDRGFLNISLWRDDVCVETFHLTPGEATRLAGFITEGLFDAAAHAVGT
jgi:hypothetical protein